MKLVFLTNRDKSHLVKIAQNHGFNVCAIILPYTSRYEEGLKPVIKLAKQKNIPLYRTKRIDLSGLLKELSPEILLSAGYPYLLKPEHLKIAKHNINIHPTLLPKYRGPAPHWYIIANGETETGLTIHEIDEGMDTGPILVQEKIELTLFDTLNTVMEKTMALEPIAFKKALDLLKKGNVRFNPQDETFASTYIETLTPLDSRIDPNKSILELYNHIRACDPKRFPAFFELDGKKIGIKLFILPESQQ